MHGRDLVVQKNHHQNVPVRPLIVRSQVMINVVKLIIILPFLYMQNVTAKTEGSLSEGMVNPGYEEQPAWFKNSFLDLDEDIEDARKSGKRLMVFFYQDGCPYCKKILQDNFGQRDIAEKTRSNFDVISLNIWGDRDVSFGDIETTEKDFAERLKVMYTPTLLFFNEEGKAVLRTNGYYHPAKFNAALDYVLGHHDKNEKFRSFLARVSQVKTKGKIYKDIETVKSPYDFSKTSDKYQLVMFEQKQCVECDELHSDILKRKESIEQLAKLNVSVLDMWSDEKITQPGGKKSSIKEWAKSLNIQYAPSLVYFNQQGEEVFRSDAYLKAFHVQSVMDYVSSGSYKAQSNFQRYIDARADKLEEQGIHVDIMK
ncbi:MAG: thioredoxin [endosymbiont of Galathealinum brachiosum]|uniref:Thioredoxin n=1 Tax=endosymbiont of Galathealinum brachiosum TaxID=2200906 RepID=A0A370DHQ2_9GAMM|nr:MAG: thioredoxin [endosymbiont of Galathealinum brachiosum]